MREEAAQGVKPLAANLLFGNDRSEDAIATTRRHLQNIGGDATATAVTLTREAMERCQRRASSGGLLLTNPPYGERLNELAELKTWYPVVGAGSSAPWRAGAPASSPPTANCPAVSASSRQTHRAIQRRA